MSIKQLRILLLGMTCLVFIRVPFFDFVNLDDLSHIDNNPYFEPLTPSRVATLWEKPHLLYMPLTYSVWAMEAFLSQKPESETFVRTASGVPKNFKFHPFLFHSGTLLFHLLSVYLVFEIFRKLFQKDWAAFLGAMLFAIHPLQAESVSWVSGLKDTLSGFFFFLALFQYLKFLEAKKISYYGLASFCFLLALLSKPSTIILPGIVGCLAVFALHRPLKETFLHLFPWVLLSLPFAMVTAHLQSNELFSFPIPPIWERSLIALDAIGFYLIKLVLPFQLAVDYGRSPDFILHLASYPWFSLCVLLFLTGGIFAVYRRKWTGVLLSFGLTLIALFPVLGLKPFVFQTTSTVSDRYMYLSLFCLGYGVTWLATRFSFSRRTYTTTGFVLFLLGLLTFLQTGNWANNIALWTHTLKVNPRSWLSYNNLGSAYEKLEDYDKAFLNYEKAAQIKPLGVFYNNMGAIRMAQERYQDAVSVYTKAIKLNPQSAIDYSSMGFAWLQLGETKKASESFRMAMNLDPSLPQPRMGLQQASRRHHK